MKKLTVLRSSGFNGGHIRVYKGHQLIWSKQWNRIEQMLSIESEVRKLLEPSPNKLYLVKGA